MYVYSNEIIMSIPQQPEKKDKFYNFLQSNSTKIFILLIVITFVAPWLFTRPWGILNFTTTGQIGDTIGGLTAPFINLLSAILIYLTFKEQIESNNLTRNEIEQQSIKEKQRLKRISEIILWDLEYRIKPLALSIKTEINNFIPQISSDVIIPTVDHVDFNSDIFEANSLNDYFGIFNKEITDLQDLCNFYNRVEFIYKNIPLYTHEKLLQEKSNAKLAIIDQARKQAYIDSIHEKHRKTMTALVSNIDELDQKITQFIAKYK